MITKQATINGTVFNIFPKCEKSYSYTHFGKQADVIANGDGSYSIPKITDANDADHFVAKDTGFVLVYDAEDKAWWSYGVTK